MKHSIPSNGPSSRNTPVLGSGGKRTVGVCVFDTTRGAGAVNPACATPDETPEQTLNPTAVDWFAHRSAARAATGVGVPRSALTRVPGWRSTRAGNVQFDEMPVRWRGRCVHFSIGVEPREPLWLKAPRQPDSAFGTPIFHACEELRRLVRVCGDCFECAVTVFSVPWLREIAKIRAVETHWTR
jgi:hypothetical protein